MINTSDKIAFGGGCYWCTEAIFLSLNGVRKVEQGFIASVHGFESFSEAVIVHYDSDVIPLKVLMEIHLNTHHSTVEHSMRQKYRSAIYTFSEAQNEIVLTILEALQRSFPLEIITKVLAFGQFRASEESSVNYYYKNPEKPFCKRFINPKLTMILNRFSNYMNLEKMEGLKITNNQFESS